MPLPLLHRLSAFGADIAHYQRAPAPPPTPHDPSGEGPSDVGTAARIADTIKQAGMAEVASLLLQTAKPLSWIGGQMLWILQPFVGHSKTVSGLAEMLEQPRSVDDLVERLNTPGERGDKT